MYFVNAPCHRQILISKTLPNWLLKSIAIEIKEFALPPNAQWRVFFLYLFVPEQMRMQEAIS